VSGAVALLALACILAAIWPFAGVLGIAASLWILPLIPMNVVVSDIRPDELLLLASLAGAAVRLAVRRDYKPTGVERAFLIFLALAVASAVLKIVFGADASLRAMALPLARQALHLALFMLVVWAVGARPGRLNAVAVTSAVAAVASSLLGIAQYYSGPVHSWIARTYPTLDGGFTYPYVPGGEGFRSMSAFDGNPNHFGVALVMMALFSAAMAQRSRTTRERLAWAAGSLVMLTAVLYTTSRASFLTAAGLLVLAFLFRQRIFGWVAAAWMALMAVLPNKMPARLLDLLGTTTGTGEVVPDPSVSGRIDMASDGMKGAPAALPMHDNFYLDLFHNFGVLSLAGFTWLLWAVGSRLWRAVRQYPASPGYLPGALLAWIALAGVSLTGGFFATQRVAEVCWILVALAFAWIAQASAGPASAELAE